MGREGFRLPFLQAGILPVLAVNSWELGVNFRVRTCMAARSGSSSSSPLPRLVLKLVCDLPDFTDTFDPARFSAPLASPPSPLPDCDLRRLADPCVKDTDGNQHESTTFRPKLILA